jgi:DNA-binding CsgD family transcriptional regulator
MDPVTGEAFAVQMPRRALTGREWQALVSAAEGHTNAVIGKGLGISEESAKTHLYRAYGKLRARNRAHAVATAFRLGWLT